jgi:hypothetical protein
MAMRSKGAVNNTFSIDLVFSKLIININGNFKYLGSMLTNDGNVLVKLNPVLLWQKLHLTRRRLCLLAK